MFIVAFLIGFSLGWSTERLVPRGNRVVRLAVPASWVIGGIGSAALFGPDAASLGLGVAVGFGWSGARAAAASSVKGIPGR